MPVTIFSDSFTGTNGSSPGSGWSILYSGTGTPSATIQGNQLALDGGTEKIALQYTGSNVANFDITFKVTIDPDCYQGEIWVRDTVASFDGDGLFLTLYADGSVLLGDAVGYSYTTIASTATGFFTPGSAYRVRFIGSGSAVSAYVWADGGSQPGSPTLSGTTSVTAANAIYLGSNSPSNGQINYFDDFVLSDPRDLIYLAAGTTAYSAASGTSVTPGYPAGLASGDTLILIVGQKPTTANGGTCSTPTGWDPRVSNTAKGGYGTTTGADVGNTNLYVFTKAATGSESGTLSVTVGDNDVCWATILALRGDATKTIVYASADGSDTSAGSVSATMGSDPGITAGDVVVAAMVIPTDITTPSQFSAEALSATGVTASTAHEVIEPDSANGNDIGGVIAYFDAITGTSSAAPTFSATAGGTTTNVRGPVSLLRVRASSVVSVNDAGYAQLGLAGLASASKTVLASVLGTLGLAGVSTASRVAKPTGSGALGLAGRATGQKVMSRTGLAAIGVMGRTTAAKRALGTALAPVGLSERPTAAKAALGAPDAALGLVGAISAAKRALGTPVAPVGVLGVAGAAKVALGVPDSSLGFVALAPAAKVALGLPDGVLGLTGAGAAAKVALGLPDGALGLSDVGGAAKVVSLSALAAIGVLPAAEGLSALVTARSALGLSAWASHTKIALGNPVGALGLAGAGPATKVSPASARALLGAADSVVAAKVVRPSALAASGFVVVSPATRRALAVVLGSVGVVGRADSAKAASAAARASLGLSDTAAIFLTLAKTGTASIGLSAWAVPFLTRTVTASAHVGLTGKVREVWTWNAAPRLAAGGWGSLEAVLEESVLYGDDVRTRLACPQCGTPLIGDWCPFHAVRFMLDQPPTIAEDTVPTDPGPWESYISILKDAASNAREEKRTPEVACPRCGEPLVAGHCPFDGYQSDRTTE